MSSESADVATRSCESAVDIFAAIAAEMTMPAIPAGRKSVAICGITCSGSVSPSAPKWARPAMPTSTAPQNATTTQDIAIIVPFRMSFGLLMAMNLVSR